MVKRSYIVLFATVLLLTVGFMAKPGNGGGTKPIDRQNFDTSVKPSEDFYQYANGGWIAKNSIPPDQSRWGSFNEVQERNYVILHDILEDAAKNTGEQQGSNLQKVGDFYFSGMDSLQIENAGAKPLEPEFKRIDAMKDKNDLQEELAHFQTIQIGVPFAFFVDQDAKNSTEEIIQLFQSGLGLPDRDYYTKTDDKSKELRDKYISHLTNVFTLVGDDPSTAATNAKTVMEMEIVLPTHR